jgi:glutamine cyclotransferase
MRLYFLLTICFLLVSCSNNQLKDTATGKNNKANIAVRTAEKVPIYTYEIARTYPHDTNSFTQGLVVHNGFFYESAGEYGKSNLRKVEIETGKVLQRFDLAREYFAEGMTILNDKIYQITWQEQTAFVYDLNFKLLKEFRYAGQGWGLTHDGTNLLLSDGTHIIRVVNPENFETIRTIIVRDENGKPLMNLNELEYVNGEIWANIWHSENIGKPNHIARISPADGKLLGWIDLNGISPESKETNSEKTLNGIAYDASSDRLFVTGKLWNKIYEVKIKLKE